MRAAAIVVASLLAGTAQAREIEVAAGVTQIYGSSPSLDAVATWDGLTLGAVEASVEVAELGPLDRLHVEVGYLGGVTSLLATAYYTDYAQVFAATALSTVPLLIVFVVFGRQIIGGIMEGAVKS